MSVKKLQFIDGGLCQNGAAFSNTDSEVICYDSVNGVIVSGPDTLNSPTSLIASLRLSLTTQELIPILPDPPTFGYGRIGIFITLMRDIKVVGLIPSISAAPSSPYILYWVFRRAATRFSRSNSFSSA